jgi:Flp pilus assembly protein TadG
MSPIGKLSSWVLEYSRGEVKQSSLDRPCGRARRSWPSLWRSTSGAAAMEFAIVVPVFSLMVFGILQYGGYIWTAHTVQQMANDSARAALAGLTETERAQIAQNTVGNEVDDYAALNASEASATETEQNQSLTVQVSYNATGAWFWLVPFIPMPPPTITRSATIVQGGY